MITYPTLNPKPSSPVPKSGHLPLSPNMNFQVSPTLLVNSGVQVHKGRAQIVTEGLTAEELAAEQQTRGLGDIRGNNLDEQLGGKI